MGEFIVMSQLRTPAPEVWAQVGPRVQFEFPALLQAGYDDGGAAMGTALRGGVRLPAALGPARVRLLGFWTLVRAELQLSELDVGRRLLTRARTRALISFEHERAVQPRPGAEHTETTLTDRIVWETRPGIPESIVRPVLQWIFRGRHRRLLHRYGAAALPPRRG